MASPELRAFVGTQGGVGTSLLACLAALNGVKGGKQILLVSPKLPPLRAYLGLPEGDTQPPPPSGSLTPDIEPGPVDGLWLSEGERDAVAWRQFGGDGVVADGPESSDCWDHRDWVARPDVVGLSLIREQVESGNPCSRIWLNGLRDEEDERSVETLGSWWKSKDGDAGPVHGVRWHEEAWQAQRKRRDVLSAAWGPLREQVWTAMEGSP